MPSLSTLPFQRGDLDPQPSWTPCTRLWLAVSSYGESPRHQPPRLLHSPTPSSSPAEATGPTCGHLGQPDLHQTSLHVSLTSITSSEPWRPRLLLRLDLTPEPPTTEPDRHPFLSFLTDSLAFLLPEFTFKPWGCWISPYLLLLPLPSVQSCLHSCTNRPRIPSLGSWSLFPFQHCPLPVTHVPDAGTLCPTSRPHRLGKHKEGVITAGFQVEAALELALDERQDFDGQREERRTLNANVRKQQEQSVGPERAPISTVPGTPLSQACSGYWVSWGHRRE